MSTPLKPRYKRTEVGVIPEDWAFSPLAECCDTSSGTTPPRSMADRYFRNGTIHWAKTLDLYPARARMRLFPFLRVMMNLRGRGQGRVS